MMLTKEFKYLVNYIYEFKVLINKDIFVSLTNAPLGPTISREVGILFQKGIQQQIRQWSLRPASATRAILKTQHVKPTLASVSLMNQTFFIQPESWTPFWHFFSQTCVYWKLHPVRNKIIPTGLRESFNRESHRYPFPGLLIKNGREIVDR